MIETRAVVGVFRPGVFRVCFGTVRFGNRDQPVPCCLVVLNGPFALAFTAGMAATVNPCGFALLPAYLSAFVGLDESSNRTTAVARGLKVSAVLTAGFVAVFGIFGIVITRVVGELQRYRKSVTRRYPWRRNTVLRIAWRVSTGAMARPAFKHLPTVLFGQVIQWS